MIMLWGPVILLASARHSCGADAVGVTLMGKEVCLPLSTVPMVAFDVQDTYGKAVPKLGSERAKVLSRALWHEADRRGALQVPKQAARVAGIVLASVRERVAMLVSNDGKHVLVPSSEAASRERTNGWHTHMGAEVWLASVLELSPVNPMSQLMNPWPTWELGFARGWVSDDALSRAGTRVAKVHALGFDAIERRAVPLSAGTLDQLRTFVTRAIRRSRGEKSHCDDDSAPKGSHGEHWKSHRAKCTGLAVLIAVETQAVSIEHYRSTRTHKRPGTRAPKKATSSVHASNHAADKKRSGMLTEKASKTLFASMGLDVQRRRRVTVPPTAAPTPFPAPVSPVPAVSDLDLRKTAAAKPKDWTAWRQSRKPKLHGPAKPAVHTFDASGRFDPDAIEGDGVVDAGLSKAQVTAAKRERFMKSWSTFVAKRERKRGRGGRRLGAPTAYSSKDWAPSDTVQVYYVSALTTRAQVGGGGGRMLASETHMALVAAAHGDKLDAPKGKLKLLSLQTGLNDISVVVARAAFFGMHAAAFDQQKQQQFRDSLLLVAAHRLAEKLRASMGGSATTTSRLHKLAAWLGSSETGGPHIDITDVAPCTWCSGAADATGFSFAVALPAHMQKPYSEVISDPGLGPHVVAGLRRLGWKLGVGDLKIDEPDDMSVRCGSA